MKSIHIAEARYWKGTLEGNQCDIVLKNLDKLRTFVNEDCTEFIDALVSVKNVLEACCQSELKPNYKNTLDDFYMQSHNLLAKYKLSLTNKIHIINDHFDFYIKRNNKSIGFYSEEGIVSAHMLNKRLTRSNYWVKDIYSEKH